MGSLRSRKRGSTGTRSYPGFKSGGGGKRRPSGEPPASFLSAVHFWKRTETAAANGGHPASQSPLNQVRNKRRSVHPRRYDVFGRESGSVSFATAVFSCATHKTWMQSSVH
ncbi:conserved hypothetical protein [Trichinella spiralis]|uniref:hypothetical protein n=1 Tax=Trichinella spiralis TaxID=6334 RepID=UPI0001EFED62|nr:conserved hypothetical protein [Trichinella spiralis]